MKERYSRNRLYVSEREQSMVRDYKIFLGGAGIGSIVAECALRFGFEHITIVDGDKVEQSNLNRQNYTENDIGRYKAECLAERLQSINPEAHIDFHTEFLAPDNIEE
uniref:ThiF family adenylyltransferase n=1 Tax=Prevotella falsenii TaxID=515414 RepID=UPI0004698DAB